MSKIWKVAPKHSDDLVKQLLFNRGVKGEGEREKFFNPSIEDYKSDLEMSGIKKAQKRIKEAIEKDELIVVYGDYDVDGVTACAILYKALTSIGAKVLPYIPHRDKEGYGLSNIGLEFARDSGAGLVITVDNGIVALEQAKFAKELGLDLIITDHHLPGKILPDAFAIVHSIKMCGAGVAWCLIRDLIPEQLSKELLEFVALGTVCDLIPLVGIGRAFVFEGLKELNKTRNIGLQNLISVCGIEDKIGSYEIGHMIGPRLNAIGRLEHAIDALRLICTKDPVKAKRLARLLNDTNLERQKLTLEAVEEAKMMVLANGQKKIHILHSEKWSSGIVGLVAARVTEEFYRPAIAMSVGETYAKGSARSVNGINIVEVIRKAGAMLVDVGGHSGAAGFSIANENIERFKKEMELIMDGQPEELERVLEIDAQVEADKLTKNLVKQFDDFEPFGFGNPRPILLSKNMKISDLRTVGEGKHLKFKVDHIDCIGFGMGEMEDELKNSGAADLAYYLEINKFNGRETLQLKIKDIRIVRS